MSASQTTCRGTRQVDPRCNRKTSHSPARPFGLRFPGRYLRSRCRARSPWAMAFWSTSCRRRRPLSSDASGAGVEAERSGGERDTAVRVRREVGWGSERGSTSPASRRKIPQKSGLSPQHSRTPDFSFSFSLLLCVSSPPPPGPELCVYFLPGKLVSDREGGRTDGPAEGGRGASQEDASLLRSAS